MKIAVLLRMARRAQRSKGRDLFPMALLARTQSEGARRLRWQPVSAPQVVWNRSNRRWRAGGARVGRPRRLRILTITGGSRWQR